jgi:hypothetical protein
MTGVAVVLGLDRSPCTTIMQVAGEGLRISTNDLQSVMTQSQSLRQGLIRFTHILAVQTGYTGRCARCWNGASAKSPHLFPGKRLRLGRRQWFQRTSH